MCDELIFILSIGQKVNVFDAVLGMRSHGVKSIEGMI